MKEHYPTRLTLLNRARDEDDPEAWEELISFYKGFIISILRGKGVHANDLENIQQQVLIKLWQGINKFEYKNEHSKFHSWIATLTRNEAINYFRRQKSHQNLIDNYKKEVPSLESDKNVQGSLENAEEQEWEFYVVSHALKKISRNFSSNAMNAFNLYTQGHSAPEISEQTGIATNTIYHYISRIKLHLIEEIKSVKQEMHF
ncbi:MAG: sigma-70 family RNA polymerase sigma factor [Verrucomicrobiota bacterium]